MKAATMSYAEAHRGGPRSGSRGHGAQEHQKHQKHQAAAAGLIAVCPVTELEFFYSARSAADRERGIADFRSLFGWVPVHDRACSRAWDVQGELTSQGQHRSAGPVDLVPAATAELHGLTLLHHDRDFGVIARVTGQPVRWYGPGP